MRTLRIFFGVLLLVLALGAYYVGEIGWRGKIAQLKDSPVRFWAYDGVLVLVALVLLYYAFRPPVKDRDD
jgi:uncharacterized BrkB/YihY/UPF0761 family membrane protein